MANRPNPELVKYIEKHLSKGFHIKQIKQKLAEAGHPLEAIEEAASFVLGRQPKKKLPRFMVVYGIILLIAIIVFLYFAWFKATQQIQYKEAVAGIQKNQSYAGRTDVELLKMAAGGDMSACSFIKTHNMYYACVDKYWETGDCRYEKILGDADSCLSGYAKKNDDIKLCAGIKDSAILESCLNFFYSGVKDISECTDQRCVQLFFESNPSVQLCEKYFGGYLDSCYRRVAEKTKNVSVCDMISDNYIQFECKSFFISTPEGLFGLCSVYADRNRAHYFPESGISGSNTEMCFFYGLYNFADVDFTALERFIKEKGFKESNLETLKGYHENRT